VAHRYQKSHPWESISHVSKNPTEETKVRGHRLPFSDLGEPRARAKTSASGCDRLAKKEKYAIRDAAADQYCSLLKRIESELSQRKFWSKGHERSGI
jgi:hypothetical protein